MCKLLKITFNVDFLILWSMLLTQGIQRFSYYFNHVSSYMLSTLSYRFVHMRIPPHTAPKGFDVYWFDA